MLKASFQLAMFSFVLFYEEAYRCWGRDIYYFVWKFSTLTWITMHLTFVYLVYFMFGQSRRIKSFLFLACYALSCVVVSGYWYLYSIKPSLVDPFIYTAYDLDYFVNLFIHGGNVLVLTWHGYTLEDFKPIHMYRLVRTDTIWIITYVSIQKASRMITGKAVYGFLDAMSYTQLVVFYFALYLIAIVIKIIVLKVIYYKLNIKIEKIM